MRSGLRDVADKDYANLDMLFKSAFKSTDSMMQMLAKIDHYAQALETRAHAALHKPRMESFSFENDSVFLAI